MKLMSPLAAIAIACAVVGAPASADEILLRDDFGGSALDTLLWRIPVGEGSFLGRTQLRPPEEPPNVGAGVVRLQLDTHNPTALVPGDSFWGSEIISQQVFERGSGLALRARVRFDANVPRGLVGSLFGFVLHPLGAHRDEITFELLSNDLHDGLQRLLTNAFDDEGFGSPGDFAFVDVPGIVLTDWIELEIRWLPDRIQWFVGGELVREERETVPEAALPVRLNFWAPSADFAAAYDAGLQPVASAAESQRYFYEVDHVEVARLHTAACPAQPLDGCRQAAKARLRLKISQRGEGSLRWTATRVEDTTLAELGEPDVGDDYSFCLFEGGDTRVGVDLPSGPAWKRQRKGFSFRNEADRLKLRVAQRAKSRLSFKSRSLSAPALPFSEQGPVVAQLWNSRGSCFSTVFDPPFKRNDRRRFVAKKAQSVPSEITLTITEIPPIGSFDDLRGKVTGLEGFGARVTGYVDVGRSGALWWGPKPTAARPGVPISGSRFTLDFTTGGIDHLARRIAVLVLPADYEPPGASGASSLPAELFEAALAFEIVER